MALSLPQLLWSNWIFSCQYLCLICTLKCSHRLVMSKELRSIFVVPRLGMRSISLYVCPWSHELRAGFCSRCNCREWRWYQEMWSGFATIHSWRNNAFYWIVWLTYHISKPLLSTITVPPSLCQILSQLDTFCLSFILYLWRGSG